MRPTATTPEQKIVLAFFDAVVDRHLPIVKKLFADDTVFTFWGDFPFSGTFRGRDAVFRGYFEPMGAYTFSDAASWEWRSMIGEGSVVVTEYVYRTRAVNGKAYENFYAQIFDVRDGKIVAVRHYCDTLYVQRTLLENGAAAEADGS